MPSCWAIDLAEIRQSSKVSPWIWSTIAKGFGRKTYQHPDMKSSVKEIIHNKIHIKTLFQYNIHIYTP
jgi:hypothetical protein